jgi:hypothetical protein
MTYRDELEQAHQRIEQLEEELVEERAKNQTPVPKPVPEPVPTPQSVVVREPSTRSRLEWWQWWSLPLTIAAGIACLVPINDEVLPWLFRSVLAGSALMSLEALLRWRNYGERTIACRLLIVLACIVGAPACIAAFFVGGSIVAVVFPVVAAVIGVVMLVRWIVKGKTD